MKRVTKGPKHTNVNNQRRVTSSSANAAADSFAAIPIAVAQRTSNVDLGCAEDDGSPPLPRLDVPPPSSGSDLTTGCAAAAAPRIKLISVNSSSSSPRPRNFLVPNWRNSVAVPFSLSLFGRPRPLPAVVIVAVSCRLKLPRVEVGLVSRPRLRRFLAGSSSLVAKLALLPLWFSSTAAAILIRRFIRELFAAVDSRYRRLNVFARSSSTQIICKHLKNENHFYCSYLVPVILL